MVIVDEITVQHTRAYWRMNVSLEVQKSLEKVAVHEGRATVEVLSEIVKAAIDEKAREIFMAEVDKRIDHAIAQGEDAWK